MVCQSCGAEVNADAFCPKCGAQMSVPPQVQSGYPPVPPAIYVSRVQRHVQMLGVLWCVYGVYRLLIACIGFFVLRTFAWHEFGWPLHHMGPAPWFLGLVPVVIAMTSLVSILSLLAGYALLTRRPWGRVLAIIAGVLALLKIPLGTALGIYTLWVLAPGVSGMEYEAIADRS